MRKIGIMLLWVMAIGLALAPVALCACASDNSQRTANSSHSRRGATGAAVPRDTPTNNYPADCVNPELSKPAPGWRTIKPGDVRWDPPPSGPLGALPGPTPPPRLKSSTAAAMPLTRVEAEVDALARALERER